MTDKIKTFAFCLLVAVALMLGAGLLGGKIGYDRGYVKGAASCPQIESDTTQTSDTSSYDSMPETIVKDSLIPFPVPVPVPVPCHEENDSVVHDTVYVYLPMEWKHAFIEDTCDIYYHGIMAAIDSTKFYFKNTVITNTVVKTDYKTPRLTLDIGAGALYHEESINPYLVGEVRYNRPKTTFAAFGGINHEGAWAAGLNVTYRMNIIK